MAETRTEETITTRADQEPEPVQIRAEEAAGAVGCARLLFGAREFVIAVGETIIGREAGAAIVIDSQAVSRRHARIIFDGARVSVADLGSKNGTFVGGIRLDNAAEIFDGTHLRIGPIWLTFKLLARGA